MAPNKCGFILVLALGFCLNPSAAAAGANAMVVEPSAPAHHFFDAKNLCLQSISILGMAADVASTHQALEVPGTRELNPLSRSQGELITLKIAGVAAGVGVAYMMHRSGHHRAERAIPLILGTPSFLAAAHNYGIHR